MAGGDISLSKPGSRRLALVLGNGAYSQKAPLSKTVGTATDLQRKLTSMGFQVSCATDQNLAGMRATTLSWLQRVEAVAAAIDLEDAVDKEPLLLMFVYCGHGSAGRLFPTDVSKRPLPEEVFCFFEDFLFRLYDVLSFNIRLRYDAKRGAGSQAWENPGWEWRPWPVQVLSVIESCRRLSKDEQQAYEQQRAQRANGRRHLLPSMCAMRPELAPMGGADWDAARLSFLSELGPNSPQLLFALSSESSTPSYDVVYLRSIVEQIDRPVRFVGILERAGLDTLRKTGHKQRPVLLLLCDQSERAPKEVKLQDLVLAQTQAGPLLLLRRQGSTSNVLDMEGGYRLQLSGKENPARSLNSRKRTSLPVLM